MPRKPKRTQRGPKSRYPESRRPKAKRPEKARPPTIRKPKKSSRAVSKAPKRAIENLRSELTISRNKVSSLMAWIIDGDAETLRRFDDDTRAIVGNLIEALNKDMKQNRLSNDQPRTIHGAINNIARIISGQGPALSSIRPEVPPPPEAPGPGEEPERPKPPLPEPTQPKRGEQMDEIDDLLKDPNLDPTARAILEALKKL